MSYGRPDLLARCLATVAEHAPGWGLRIWDNRSADSASVRDLADQVADAHWHFHEENIGFAAAVNRLAEGCVGDFLLLNPDAELLAPLTPLVNRLERDGSAAAVAPFVEVGGLRPWDNSRRLPGPVRMLVEFSGYGHALRAFPISQRYRVPPRTAGYSSGACLLVRRSAWLAVGPFDEQFWLYGEEVDWARRARKLGWHIGVEHVLLASHIGGGTQTVPDADGWDLRRGWLFRTQRLYLDKHFGSLAGRAYARGAGSLLVARRGARRVRRVVSRHP